MPAEMMEFDAEDVEADRVREYVLYGAQDDDTMFGMTLSEEDMQPLDGDERANYHIRMIREDEAELMRLQADCDREVAKHQKGIDDLRSRLMKNRKPLGDRIAWRKSQLMMFMQGQRTRKLKTEEQYVLARATLKLKHPAPKFTPDKDAMLAWAKEERPALVNRKTVESVNWADIKKEGVVDGTRFLIDGEPVEFVQVEPQPSTLEIV